MSGGSDSGKKPGNRKSKSTMGSGRGKVHGTAVKRASPRAPGMAGAGKGTPNPLKRADAMASAAAVFSEEGNHAKATELFSEAIRFTAPLWFARGLEALNASDPRQAAASLKMAADLDPENAHAWMFQGIALVKCGKAREGLAAIRAAIRRDDDNAQAWFYKACAHHALGQRKSFEEALRKAYSLDPVHVRLNFGMEELLEKARNDPDCRELTRFIMNGPADGEDSALSYIM